MKIFNLSWSMGYTPTQNVWGASTHSLSIPYYSLGSRRFSSQEYAEKVAQQLRDAADLLNLKPFYAVISTEEIE